MRPSARFSARAPCSIRRACPRLLHRACWSTTARPSIGSPRESRSCPILISCSTRSRWPLLAPDSSGARGRSRERHSTLPKDVASAKPRQIYASAAAVWEAFSGNQSAARQRAVTALGMSNGRDVSYAGGFALALAGDITRSEALANDLERQYPRDTLVRFTYVPTLRALAAIARNQPAMAIELLQANVPYERAVPATAFNFFFGSLYPVYVRGQAYAASGLHQQAVAEFQKILDHPGLMMGDPAGARARLEKARSLARAGEFVGRSNGVRGLPGAVEGRRPRCADSGAGEGGVRETAIGSSRDRRPHST